MPMRVPLSWLKEYVDIPVPPEQLAAGLTLAGLEVEKLHVIGAEWDKVYVGQIATLDRHPDADRLWLTQVEYGADQPLQVVTGAPNLHLGAKVPLALAGAVLIDGHNPGGGKVTLKPTKMRGIMSAGMVCSELELGLSQEHEGILILSDDAPVGAPLQQVLGDVVLELDVTPNLGRALGLIGIAREVKAIFGGTVRLPSTAWHDDGPPVADALAVEIADPDLCARYIGAVIDGVTVGPSPAWLQRRLTLAGLRPINNIVDITQYVMWEYGQPLHAFDYDLIEGHRIIVRRARPGEQIRTIDHVDRPLDPQMLVIADAERPVALAGVMGGETSEVSDGTTRVLLESANFEYLNVRRTARLLKIRSDASHRFERNVDPNVAEPALRRAAELMRELGGGTIRHGMVDRYPRPRNPIVVSVTPHETERLLGLRLSAGEIATHLRRLDFAVEVPPGAADDPHVPLDVTVPTYRNDVTIAADLVEEVARMVGYDNIPETLLGGELPPQQRNITYEMDQAMRDRLAAAGLDEVISYALISRAMLERMGPPVPEGAATGSDDGKPRPWRYLPYDPARPLVALANPISQEQEILRPNLLPSLLATLRANLRNEPRIAIFEVSHVYWSPTPDVVAARQATLGTDPRWPALENEADLPEEPLRVAGLLTGPRLPRSRFARADASDEQMDFFDAKGVVEAVLRGFNIRNVRYEPVAAAWFHPGRVAAVVAGDQLLGVVGELHPRLVAAWELPDARIGAFDLDMAVIEALGQVEPRHAPPSRYPATMQDLAVIVPDAVPAARVEALIRETGGKLLVGVTLFDVYTGPPVPPGARSLAYSLAFQALDRTLSEEDVTKLRTRIIARLQREVGAQLRA